MPSPSPSPSATRRPPRRRRDPGRGHAFLDPAVIGPIAHDAAPPAACGDVDVDPVGQRQLLQFQKLLHMLRARRFRSPSSSAGGRLESGGHDAGPVTGRARAAASTRGRRDNLERPGRFQRTQLLRVVHPLRRCRHAAQQPAVCCRVANVHCHEHDANHRRQDWKHNRIDAPHPQQRVGRHARRQPRGLPWCVAHCQRGNMATLRFFFLFYLPCLFRPALGT